MKVINHHQFSANIFQNTKRFPKIQILMVGPITFIKLSDYFHLGTTKLVLTQSLWLFLSFLSVGISDLDHSFIPSSKTPQLSVPFFYSRDHHLISTPLFQTPGDENSLSNGLSAIPTKKRVREETDQNSHKKALMPIMVEAFLQFAGSLILLKHYLDHDTLLR